MRLVGCRVSRASALPRQRHCGTDCRTPGDRTGAAVFCSQTGWPMRTRCFRLAMSPGASRAEALIPRRGAGGSVIVAIIAHGTSPRPVRPGPWAVAIALEWEYGIPLPGP